MNGFILGVDWLAEQGLVWDFPKQQIQFPDGERMDLRKEEDRNRVRRIYVTEDTILLLSQQTPVNVRITHRTPTDRAYMGILETEAIPSLPNVYSARSLIPAKFSGIQVPLLNTAKCCQIVTKGTELGVLQGAEVIDEVTEEPSRTKTESVLRHFRSLFGSALR